MALPRVGWSAVVAVGPPIVAKDLIHASADVRADFAFPDSDNSQPLAFQGSCDGAISHEIPIYLRSPVFYVCFWDMTALRTAMPEASIHEDRYSLARQEKIRQSIDVLWVHTPPADCPANDFGS